MILLARRDPRRRELQNRAKKERKDLMKCGEDSKSAECVSKGVFDQNFMDWSLG